MIVKPEGDGYVDNESDIERYIGGPVDSDPE